jgi:hypothetical protein
MLTNLSKNVYNIYWKKASNDSIVQYQSLLLSDKEFIEFEYCDFVKDGINRAYTVISASLLNSACHVLPQKCFKEYLKPFWNDELSSLHKKMLLLHKEWCRDGRPRGNDNAYYVKYKSSKRDFRKMLRKCSEDLLIQEDNELDRSAEIASTQFRKLVNSRQRKSQCKMTEGIDFHGKIIRGREQISKEWGLYFQSLYTFNESQEYYEYWKQSVTATVNETMGHIATDKTVHVLPDTVSEAIQTLPVGKACGEDNLVYEHLIY